MTAQHSLFEVEPESPKIQAVPVTEKLKIEKCDFCPKVSAFGCHGINEGKAYSIFLCENHYNSKMKRAMHG